MVLVKFCLPCLIVLFVAGYLQENDGHYYQVDVHMSLTQYEYLKDYVDRRQNSTAEVHSILSSMLQNFRLS